ncbi:MAG: SBBP repeat-containing protein [Ignavibacteria bacterium]
MKISFFIFLSFLFFSVGKTQSQYNSEWAGTYSGVGVLQDGANAIVVNDSGETFVTGYIEVPTLNFNYATIKYDKFGNQLWAVTYGNEENSIAFDLAVDDTGNVYVAGGGPIIKYNRYGSIVWVSERNQGNHKIKLDSLGFIYVAGMKNNIYITAKYDKNGIRLWNRTYNYQGDARLRDMVIDNWGNIIVTGDSRADSTDYDYTTIKYTTNGDQVWVRRYNGISMSPTPSDRAYAVDADDMGNIYVTGVSRAEISGNYCVTIKYDSSGNEIWVKRISEASGGFDIKVDNPNNIYVAGRYGGSNYTFKMDSSANILWGSFYIGGSILTSNYPKLLLDSFKNVFVTTNYVVAGSPHFGFLKYDSLGNQLSLTSYNTQYNGAVEYVNNIAIDKKGNVYLTGESWISGTTRYYDFLTVKFKPIMTNIGNEVNLINDYFLSQNYPNPFNPSTNINFQISKDGLVRIKIYDVSGREVKILINEFRQAGNYSVVFDGNTFASGVYFYRLESNKFVETKRMVMIK